MVYDLDENIMELIAKPPIEIEEPPMYVSKFRNSVKRASIHGKSAHKTFGVPRVSLNPPQEFLRKHSRNEIQRTDIKHKHYHIPDYPHKLPEWKSPKKPILYYVDDRRGNSFPRKPASFSACQNVENENPQFYLEKNRMSENARKKIFNKFINNTKTSDQSSAKSEKSSEYDGLESKDNNKKSFKKHSKEPNCRYVSDEERAQLLSVS
ncbi:enkurin-like [Microplitis mediator]|uniref:enkurin-like n=1 Tax=Microplitis mediator TaxID=375433 RepID=UPI00255578A6|nr:enkurin-like [Microplitis mediator]